METKNRSGGYDLITFNEQKAMAVKLIEAKPVVKTEHMVHYRQIREDMISHMGFLQRKRKSQIARENMQIYQRIQDIAKKPSATKKTIESYYDVDRDGEKLPHKNMKQSNQTLEIPSFIVSELARIQQANVKIDSRLNAVRSHIPMNSAVRKEQSALMDNYRKFASKYKGQIPTLDPLLQKKLYHEVKDVSPGSKMLSLHNMSRASLNDLPIEFNEGSLVGRRNYFKQKSQSINGQLSQRQKQTFQRIISSKKLRSNKNLSIDKSNNDLVDGDNPIVSADFKVGDLATSRFQQNKSELLPESPDQEDGKNPQGSRNKVHQSTKSLQSTRRNDSGVESLPRLPSYASRTNIEGKETKSRTQFGSPTLLRAVDSTVMIALKQNGKAERIAKKKAILKTNEMDLKDLINRLQMNAK